MSAYVDYDIGPWVVMNEDAHTIAIVSDIDEHKRLICEAMMEKSPQAAKNLLLESLDYIEFGMVTVQKNGMVKWKGGEFIPNHDDDE